MSLIVVIEAGENLEHGALAAAGWADEHANLPGAKREFYAGEHVVAFAGRVFKLLAGYIDLKLHGVATAIAAFQMAAPARFR